MSSKIDPFAPGAYWNHVTDQEKNSIWALAYVKKIPLEEHFKNPI